MVIFPGTVIMWGLSVGEIPVGWALCDGTSGTPDLRDRFIYGASGSVAVGSTGGAATVTLVANELPLHSHAVGTVGISSTGFHDHLYTQVDSGTSVSVSSASSSSSTAETFSSDTTDTSGSHTHTISGNTASVGSGDAHNNLPPYRAVLFIMKL